MTDMICVDKNYSTTRLLTREKPTIENKPEDKFESVLFLPEGVDRNGEGGLRTQGYFKTSQTDKPLITVVTVVFNGEKYLEETIQSVINQTYDNVEYIIIDGGSTDGTLDIIRKYEYAIDYWVSEGDGGIYDAMNKGVCLSAGEWVYFVNIGDKIIEIPFRSFKSNLSIVSGNVWLFPGKKKFTPSFDFRLKLFNTLHHQGTYYKRKSLELYDLNYRVFSDFDLNQKLYKQKIGISIVNRVLAAHRLDGVSNLKDNFNENYQITRKNYGIFFLMLSYFAYKYRGVRNAIFNISGFVQEKYKRR